MRSVTLSTAGVLLTPSTCSQIVAIIGSLFFSYFSWGFPSVFSAPVSLWTDSSNQRLNLGAGQRLQSWNNHVVPMLSTGPVSVLMAGAGILQVCLDDRCACLIRPPSLCSPAWWTGNRSFFPPLLVSCVMFLLWAWLPLLNLFLLPRCPMEGWRQS